MHTLNAKLADKIEALQNNGYFQGLSAEALGSLAQDTFLRSYARNEAVCWQGEACAGLYILKRGSVKLFKLSPKGRELIIKTFEQGATFNEVPTFDNGPNPINVAALEDSLIWIVEAQAIRKALGEHPEMAQAVILNLTQNLRMLVSTVEELSFYQVTNRLARLLSQLPPEQLSGPAAGRLTQDQLAARLGTVREVVARSLRDLERSGAIRVSRRQIQVLDVETLHDWAQEPYA
ncbi:MAG: Crp/Fnr family transcriptional regulator [Chloroflexota bacterium]